MEQFLPSFHKKPSVSIGGVFSWGFQQGGMAQQPLSNSPTRTTEPGWANTNHPCDPTAGTRHQQTPLSSSNLSDPLSASTRCLTLILDMGFLSRTFSWVLLSLAFQTSSKSKRTKSNQNQACANHSQAAALTGPKRFQTDLSHILFSNHHFFKDTLSFFFFSFFSGTFYW